MFWFVVFGSFLGADVAQMTLMLGPFSAETQCWEIGAATIERIITIDPESAYRGACFDLLDQTNTRLHEARDRRALQTAEATVEARPFEVTPQEKPSAPPGRTFA